MNRKNRARRGPAAGPMRTNEEQRKRELLAKVARAGDTVESIYAEVAIMECKGLCQHSCTHLGMAQAEVNRLTERGIPLPMELPNGECSHLTEEGKCAIYEDRPLVCRVWGQVAELACPHGCEPMRYMFLQEVVKRLGRLYALTPENPDAVYTGTPEHLAETEQFGRDMRSGKVNPFEEGFGGKKVPIMVPREVLEGDDTSESGR